MSVIRPKNLEKYYQLNVEPTARPLAINVDYNNALELCYEDIAASFSGRKAGRRFKAA